MLQVALLGAGRIGQVHAANIHSHPNTRLHSVVDVHQAAAKTLAAKYAAQSRTLEEVLQDQTIDIVMIASATDTHSNLIELAAKAGKAAFCEKPVDLSSERVAACLEVVKKCRTPLMIGFNRRFDPQFSALKQAYQQGKVGKAEMLHITSRDPEAPPVEYVKVSGGLFRDMSIHDLDMVRYVLDEDPIAVSASGSCVIDKAIGDCGDIDTAVITLEFASGVIATISNSRRTTYGYDQRIELHGSGGMIQAGNIIENTLTVTGSQGAIAAKPEFFFLERYAKAYMAEWDHFVQSIVNKTPPCVSGIDGEKALLLADAALLALQTGQRQTLNWSE